MSLFRRNTSRDSSGFTMIEVLVVVAIIGVLAAIIFANFDSARKQSRDKVRKSDLKQLQLAIELYKAQNGSYPVAGCGAVYPQWAGSESSYTSASVNPCPLSYISGLAPNFIGGLPAEPGSDKVNKGFVYTVSADGSMYKVLSHHNVESQLVSGYGDEFARFANPTSCGSNYPDNEKDVYAVYSAGAECW